MSTLRRWIRPVAARADAEHWARTRHELWAWANAAPAFQRSMSMRAKERKAAIRATPETEARLGTRSGGRHAGYVVTVGRVTVSDERYPRRVDAEKAAKAFSKLRPEALVDVRTAVALEKVAHFRAGHRVIANRGKG